MFISVCVPVYNDPDGIRDTLDSLLKLEYPEQSHEIIVVDNGSTDKTRSVVERRIDEQDHVDLLVRDDIQSSYAARNKGIDHAAGEIIAFLDADMTVPRDWLDRLTDVFESTGADYVGCNVEMTIPDGESTLAARYNAAHGFPVKLYMELSNFAPTNALSVRANVLETVGGFDETLVSGGDLEFGQRVHAAGYQQHFAADLTIYHPARTRFMDLIRKELRQGRGQEQRYQRYKSHRPIYHPRNVLPPNPFYYRRRLGSGVGHREFVFYWWIAYVLKLIKIWGRLRETVLRRMNSLER